MSYVKKGEKQLMKNFIKPLIALKTKSGYSIFSVVIVAVFSAWGITDALQAEVTYAADGESQTVKSSNETVGELLDDLEIEVTNNDYISHAVDETLEDGMEIEHIPAKEVVIIIDGKEETYETTATNVGSLFKEKDLTFSDQDDVSHSPSTKIEDGLVIDIEQAFEVPIDNAGEKETVWTTGGTVEEVLVANDLKPGKSDKVKPGKKEEVTKETEIKVTGVTKETVVEEETIDFKTKEKTDSNLEKGRKKVIQQGSNGNVEKTYELVLENGKEVEKTEIDKKVLQKAKKEIVSIGTKEKPKAIKQMSNSAPSGGETKTMQATAYTADCNGCSGVTATGINLSSNRGQKVVAVDPSVIPLGSRVWVSGYGEAIAGDTGGDIKGNRIDLHFPDKGSAHSFGRKSVTVKVIN